jgi:hypothetical protein
MEFIKRAMNMTIIFLPHAKKFHTVQDESGNYVGYTALLMTDEADVALGTIMRSIATVILLDVTKSYFQVIWEWYVPCPIKYPGWKSIFRIFSPTAWLSIFLAAMLAIIAIVFLARFGGQECEFFRCAMDAIIDVRVLIFGVSISLLPRKVPLRLFLSAWVCYSLAINTVFQAYLTTFLVDPGFEKSIKNLEEIFTSGINYGFLSIYFDSIFKKEAYHNSRKSNRLYQSNHLHTLDCEIQKYFIPFRVDLRGIFVLQY